MEDNYPDKIIRGISSPDYIKDGLATYSAIEFRHNLDRDDNYLESSINWFDNDEAYDIAFSQRREGSDEFQFKGGLAILNRHKIDEVIKVQRVTGILTYERKPIEGNDFHGNLLCDVGVERVVKKMISSCIAMMCVEKIIIRE